ncbi:MAG: hypothetical protein IKD69_03020 [Solobacterium sp.]|nr:hypothetical protein [Solobacterium sp.]
MKNKDLLIDAFSEMDDALLYESMTYQKEKQGIPFLRIALLVFGLVLAAVVLMQLYPDKEPQVITTPDPEEPEVIDNPEENPEIPPEEVIDELPEIREYNYMEGGVMGSNEYVAMVLSDMVFASPFAEGVRPETLPVYYNPFANPQNMEIGLPAEEMLDIAKQYAEVFDIDLATEKDFTYEGYIQSMKFTGGRTVMYVYGNGDVVIDFNSPLPEETDPEKVKEYAERYIGRHPELFPKASYTAACQSRYFLENLYAYAEIYEDTGTAEGDMAACRLNNTQAYFNEEGKLKSLIIHHDMVKEHLGDYPLISLEEAQAVLEETYGIADHDIAYSDLVYSTEYVNTYCMPYYVFYVPTTPERVYPADVNKDFYKEYYIPAVSPRYLAEP